MSEKLEKQEIENQLPYFTGTTKWYRVSKQPPILLTEGTKFLLDSCGMYWFLSDFVILCLLMDNVKDESFIVFSLDVDLESKEALVKIGDGNNNILYQQEIQYTDCPLDKVKMYYSNEVLMLPSEY